MKIHKSASEVRHVRYQPPKEGGGGGGKPPKKDPDMDEAISDPKDEEEDSEGEGEPSDGEPEEKEGKPSKSKPSKDKPKDKKEPKAGRIFGPIPRELQELGYQTIISRAPEVV